MPELEPVAPSLAQSTSLTLTKDDRGELLPSKIFAGCRLLVVGGTGFLGKVWISMILHRFPELEHIYLVVRPKGQQTTEARFWAEIAPSESFDPLRERYPGNAFEKFLKDKVTPVGGDMSRDLVGIAPDLLDELRGNTHAVVNVAGVVDFNPPLDEALGANAFGVNNLIALAKELDAPVMHTSTCYVAGYRTGLIEEVDPREVPFPRADGAPGARLIAKPDGIPVDRKLDRSHWDPQNEIRECLDVIEHVRHRCEDAFRQSLFLDEAKHNLKERGEPCRGEVLADELAKIKRKFVRDKLMDAGLERALYWGWPNTYTYTKSIGEQVLAASGVRNTIVRPAVVESANVYPFPGWNEGINTSAPFIYMALNGQVQFPSDPEVCLDIIPCDMVCFGMIAALAELLEGTHRPVYQFGAGDTNPCRIARFMELIGLYKRKKWQDGGDSGNPVMNAILARIEPVHLTKAEYERQGAHALANVGSSLANLLDVAAIGPAASFLKPLARSLKKASSREHKMGDVIDLFIPFVAECEWIFSCRNTRMALHRMPADERARFHWQPEKINWREWMFEVHIPAIEKWATPHFEERLKRETKPLRTYANLLDLLDEMAERHDHSVALRMLTDEGFTRTTFIEWRERSASVAARLAAAQVGPGDRVLLSGNNCPEWPIAYFGILRAGAVAVPVDPKLSGKQIANVIHSSGARVAIFGEEVREEGGKQAIAQVPELNVLDLQAVAINDGNLRPPPVQVGQDDLASIIYTSGTTGDPKGVMLSHGNFCSLLAGLSPMFNLRSSDGVMSVLPLHHTFEFSCGLLLPMSRGCTINYIGEIDADRLGEGLSKARISAMVGVPALWQLLERRMRQQVRDRGPAQARAFDWALELNRILGKNLGLNAGKLFFGQVHERMGGKIRYLISGGSALPKSTAKTFAGLGLKLSEGYGLTEAAPVLTVSMANNRSRGGQVGKAIPGVEIKINDPNAAGVGEVFARGPNVMQGYFANEDATRHTVDDDGWLHTGDLGKLDKKGRLVLAGRSKDVIVSTSGENVYPDDVEDMLGNVAHVDELSIVGLNKGDTEVVACLAVPERREDKPRRQSHALAMRSLKDAIGTLPRHCQPTVVQLYDADLPKTATRKVKRSAVVEILERLLQATAQASSGSGEASGRDKMVRQAIAGISGRAASEILPTMSLAADLGFDSLMSMELTVALESQLGRPLPQEKLSDVNSVADLVAVCSELGRQRSTEVLDDEEESSVSIPPWAAALAKKTLSRAQLSFYDRVMKPEVLGRSFIPHNRNTIVISNHSSHLDMGFVKYALGDYGQDMVALAAADYFFEGKWRRTYFEKLTNLQAFDRRTNLRQALREANETIRSGKTVLLFPEGTRSSDGTLAEFKSTLGHLALSSGVDILPMYLEGTYESWPKGRAVPTKRKITARIGPPLKIEDLRRLTDEKKFAAACRSVADLAHAAIVELQRRSVLSLEEFETLDAAMGKESIHPLVELFQFLQTRYIKGKLEKPLVYYFSLGNSESDKWTARLDAEQCDVSLGKPQGQSADCVLKTSAEIFSKIVREGYMPTPIEVMSGQVKSNDVSLLATFQEAFDLS